MPIHAQLIDRKWLEMAGAGVRLSVGTLIWIMLAACCIFAQADSKNHTRTPSHNIIVAPSAFTLDGFFAKRRLVVEDHGPDGRIIDVTGQAHFLSSDPKILRLEGDG